MFRRISRYVFSRYDKLDFVPPHFFELAGRNTLLQSEKVFGFYSVSLIEDLPPPVFAGCFGP